MTTKLRKATATQVQTQSGTQMVVQKEFGTVGMTVSKKEIIESTIEVKLNEQEEVCYRLQDEVAELSNLENLLTEAEKKAIESEVKSNKKVKAYVEANTEMFAEANEPRVNRKVGVEVDVNYRQDNPNIAVKYTTKYTTMYFGTCEERFQSGTFDLKDFSPTAKIAVKKLKDHMKKLEAKEKELETTRKNLDLIKRRACQVKHEVNKSILASDEQGRAILKQMAELEKKLSVK